MSGRLTVFDLDHTLLDGDSDQFWCAFLIDQGMLDVEGFGARDRALQRDYRSGQVGTMAFCEFYIGTLAGRSAGDWRPLIERFVHQRVLPRVRPGARALLGLHRDRGDLLVLSTATNRLLTEATAAALGFEHLIATDCATDEQGRLTGRVCGEPNMREGKITRLNHWLAERGLALGAMTSRFYSDSTNDLPLLEAVDEPVVVHGDERLRSIAAAHGWPCLELDQPPCSI